MHRLTLLLLLATSLLAPCLIWSPAARAQPALGPVLHSIRDLAGPYPVEQHSVTTQDGYILTLFRVPYGLKTAANPSAESSTHQTALSADQAAGLLTSGGCSSRATTKGAQQTRKWRLATPRRRPVVFLQHGLLDSCAGFLLAGPDSGLAFLLADAGFDVWLGNSRGSTQAREHAWLSPASAEYWAFSFDEMARYDLPASIEYVLRATRQDRVSFVSHSQGGTIMLAALASQPQLASSLGLLVLMAPVATATHMTSVPLQALAALGTEGMFSLLGLHEFMPSVRVVSWMEGQLCTTEPDLCVSILAAICGYRRHCVNTTRLPLYLQYTPAGTSVQNMAHWAQAVRGGARPGRPQLTHFDYGTHCTPSVSKTAPATCNQEMYNSLTPPAYHLGDIPSHVRMVLFTGGQDRLANPVDTELLLEALPAGVVAQHQHDPDLEHLDYIWGADAPTRIYTKVLQALLEHTPTAA